MLWIILAVIVFIVAATFLLFRLEDLSHLDGDNPPVREGKPSPANREVLGRIREMGESSRGLRGKARLMALRKHMDGLSEGLELASEFRFNASPRGEWVLAPGCDTAAASSVYPRGCLGCRQPQKPSGDYGQAVGDHWCRCFCRGLSVDA